MWVYQQSTGRLYHGTTLVATGYAGHGEGVNNPAMQHVENVGPLPCGFYTIQSPVDHPHCGRYALRLVPDAENDMGGRAGFLMHGDNPDMNFTASNGCPIQAYLIRKQVWESGDHRLQVVPGPPAS